MVAGAHPGYRPWNAIDPVAQAPSTLVIATRVGRILVSIAGIRQNCPRLLRWPQWSIIMLPNHTPSTSRPISVPPASSRTPRSAAVASREAGVGILAKG